jgi:hypothetical protein
MSDREREAFRKAVETVAPDPALDRTFPAVVRGQRSDGTLDVDFEEGGPQPRASGVEPVYGLPATSCRFKADARLHVAYKAGDPRKRVATRYGSYPPVLVPDSGIELPEIPVEEINIAHASSTQGAARQGDPIAAGSITWAPTPPAAGIPTGGVLTYTAFPSADNPTPTPTVWSVVGPIVITQVSPNPGGPVSIDLAGAIRGGSAIVKIGG